jgi:hypothetical protein
MPGQAYTAEVVDTLPQDTAVQTQPVGYLPESTEVVQAEEQVMDVEVYSPTAEESEGLQTESDPIDEQDNTQTPEADLGDDPETDVEKLFDIDEQNKNQEGQSDQHESEELEEEEIKDGKESSNDTDQPED